MRPNLLTILALVLAGAASAGCINARSNRGVEPLWQELDASDFESGVTTRAEVLERLGPPSQILSLAEGTAFYYLFETNRARGVVLVVYNNRNERTRYSRAVFFFDEEGTLGDFAISEPVVED